MDSPVAEFPLDAPSNTRQAAPTITPGDPLQVSALDLSSDAIAAGLALLLDGNVEQAQAVWWAAIADYPLEQINRWITQLGRVLQHQAHHYRSQGAVHQSLRLCQYWVEIDDGPQAHFDLAELLARLGRFDEAIAHWQQALRQEPDFIAAHRSLGQVLQRLQHWEQAIAAYRQVLTHQPSDYDTHYRLAHCLIQTQQWDDAIAHLSPLLPSPNWSGVALDMAYIRLQQGRCEDAIGHLRRWTQFNPGVINTYLTWISTLANHYYNNAAIASNAELLWMAQRPSANADLLFILGKLLAQQQHYGAALQAFQTVLRHASSVEFPYASGSEGQALPRLYPLQEVQLEIVRVLLALHRPEDAITLAQRVGMGSRNDAKGHLALATALMAIHRWDDALHHYQQAVQLAPHWLEPWLGCAAAQLALGDWSAAQGSAQSALDLDGNAVNAWYCAGRACWEQGDLEGAIASLRQALRLTSETAQAMQRWLHPTPEWLDGERQRQIQTIQPIHPPSQTLISSQLGQRPFSLGTATTIYPAQHIPLTPPKSLDPAPHFSFRFGDGIQLPAPCVAQLPQGRFWIAEDQSSSAAITATEEILRDLSPEFPLYSPGHPTLDGYTHRLLTLSAMEPAQRLAGYAVVLAGLSNDMYFHWMTDVLPRLDLLQRAGIDLDQVDHFIVRRELPFQKQTLDWFNIPAERCVDIQDWRHWQADHLIVPSSAGAIAWMTPEALQFLRSALLPRASTNPPRASDKLYISRSQTANRRVINEPTLVRYLETLGFQAVHLESLSMADQIALFAQAKVVVSPHGSGLTNSIFCQPGTKIIELFSPNFVYPCYWYLANLAHLDYYYLVGDRPFGQAFHPLLYPNSRTEDVFVSEHQLMALLAIAQAI